MRSKWTIESAKKAINNGMTLRELQANGYAGALNFLYRYDPKFIRDNVPRKSHPRGGRRPITINEALNNMKNFISIKEFQLSESHSYQLLLACRRSELHAWFGVVTRVNQVEIGDESLR